jgi:hypothetical protein
MTDNTDVSAAVEAAQATANSNDALAGNIERLEFRPMPDPRKHDDDEPVYRSDAEGLRSAALSFAARSMPTNTFTPARTG